jgi:uncharacterized protein YigE (DUF2233 family)
MKILFVLALIILQTAVSPAWTIATQERLTAPEGVAHHRKMISGGREVEAHLVIPNRAKYTLSLVDNPAGERTLADAVAGSAAVVAVNGGYFHPDFEPLGLAIANGKTLHSFQRARLLSGLVMVKNGRISLLRAAEFNPATKPEMALQAGPFLIDKSVPVQGLNNTRAAARTVILSDGNGGFALFVCRSATLAQTAEILATRTLFPEFKIIRALNLDGGSSTALMVGGESYFREFKRVRNFLAVVPK